MYVSFPVGVYQELDSDEYLLPVPNQPAPRPPSPNTVGNRRLSGATGQAQQQRVTAPPPSPPPRNKPEEPRVLSYADVSIQTSLFTLVFTVFDKIIFIL